MFEVDRSRVEVGSKVIAHTIWGDEAGLVLEVLNGFAKIALERGDIIYMSRPSLMVRDE